MKKTGKYEIKKKLAYSYVVRNKEDSFEFVLPAKMVKIEGKAVGISHEGVDLEEQAFCAYLNSTKDDRDFIAIPRKKPDVVTKGSYGFDVVIVCQKKSEEPRYIRERIFIPKFAFDGKRGVLRRDIFEECEWKLLSSLVRVPAEYSMRMSFNLSEGQ